MRKLILFLFAFYLGSINPAPAYATSVERLTIRANQAADILDEYMADFSYAIPDIMLKNAKCIMVVPNVLKVGFFYGAKVGRGLVSCRIGSHWSDPSFTQISGGSFGLQAGIQETDLVLIFTNRASIIPLTQGNFTLGAGGSISIGPVGRDTQVSTDYLLKSSIFTYSRSRGVFAGISLEGSVINPLKRDNNKMYGRWAKAVNLLTTYDPDPPAGVMEFLKRLDLYSPGY